MFLSSTDQSPSNNPSSSSSKHLTNSSDELGQSHLASFSIRDYAFSNRTKNFKKSWPFSSTSLQLCLKHGLSDPLPPIQTLGCVISHPPEALSLKKPDITLVKRISHKRKSEKLDANQTLAKTKEVFENGLSASGLKSKIQVAISNKNPRKKIGLIVKPSDCMDIGSKEDHSCHFAAFESMSLRTCPICKTFSSASNTTLNAHIDQCLSEQQPISKPNRSKAKPRMKVKSMIDIYASAKGCTLEDLDQRNRTGFTISSYSNRVCSDNKPEVFNKGKKRSVLRVCVDEDASGIGPVYIDDKGQKLRILSKKTSDPSREHEDASEKKSSEEGKGSKSFRKRLWGKKDFKYHKQVSPSRKLTVRKCNTLEIPEYQRGYSAEGRGMERSETPGQGQHRIYNQQMQTKHRLSRNGHQKGVKDRVLRDQPSHENGHSLSGNPQVSTDLSETVSSSINSQISWRVSGESQVSGKSSALSRRKSTKGASHVADSLKSSIPMDQAFASEANDVMKLKKARLDFSENEDTGKWESEMTQEREVTDYDDWDDDNEGTDKVVLSDEDNDYESYEETGNNKRDDDILDKTDEFESMIYVKTGSKTAEQGSSFMEVDPIPIPGPPGSFLQSPWDIGTENHGNSSVIISHVQSSQDQLDLTDRNSSESPVSAMLNFTAPETHSHHNIITIDKIPSRFRDNDQSCCCQEKALENRTTSRPPPHMIQHDLDFQSKPVPAIPSSSNPVLRLMGKDLMVINQSEEPPSLKPTSHFLETQQVSSSVHLLYGHYGGSFYNIP